MTIYRTFRLGPVFGQWRAARGGFFRLWANGPGLELTCAPSLFSERSGYTKRYPVGFGWRVRLLTQSRTKL